MANILNTNVTVHNPETGESVTIPKGTDVPSDVRDLITNPDVFDDGDNEASDVPTPGPSQSTVSEGANVSEFGSGPFRSRSAAQVRALAEAHGLDASNKDEAIAALEAEGIEPDDSVPTSTDTNVEP